MGNMEPRVPTPSRAALPGRRARARRRASALVYVTAAFVALAALGSLAVDLGRVYLVRSELQLAADAAARYAAAGFVDGGITGAEDNAVNAADDNTADGTPVVLQPAEDIEFGTWNASTRQFTTLAGPARAGADAIRVIARRTSARRNAVPLGLGRVVGLTSCDAQATSVARLARRGGAAFVGIGQMQVGNNVVIAGYNSAAGAPGGANLNDSVTIGSNGQTEIGNNGEFGGSVLLGPLGSFSGPSVTVDRLTSVLSYPPVESPTVASSGALFVPSHTTRTLAGGTHSFTSVTLDEHAELIFTGPATVYVDGDLNAANDPVVMGFDSLPGNLRIRVRGSHQVSFGNNASLYYDINLPSGSAGGTITILR